MLVDESPGLVINSRRPVAKEGKALHCLIGSLLGHLFAPISQIQFRFNLTSASETSSILEILTAIPSRPCQAQSSNSSLSLQSLPCNKMLQAIPQLPTVRHSMNHYPYPAHAVAASHDDGKIHLLLGASGSVAVIKLPLIARALLKHTPPSVLSIRIVLTPSATKFLAGQSPEQPTVSALGHIDGVDGVYTDKDEWGPEPWRRGQPILHVELRK